MLTNHGVKDDHQGKLFENGVDALPKFAAFVTTAKELADLLKSDFSLDPAASLDESAQVASYTVAWQADTGQSASGRRGIQIRDMAKPIPTTDYMAMRQSFAKSCGELEDR